MAPEAVADAGRDHQEVVRDTVGVTLGGLDLHERGVEIGAHDATVDDVHGVEAPEPSERHEVRAAPSTRVGQSGAQLLAAHERRARGDPDDPTRAGQPGRDQHAGVAETGHDDGRPARCHSAPPPASTQAWASSDARCTVAPTR